MLYNVIHEIVAVMRYFLEGLKDQLKIVQY
jgi:hypothetical protein